jgi:MFS family permease
VVRRRWSAARLSVSNSPRYQRWLLLVTLTGIFTTSFPTGILSISVKVIAVDLHSTPSTITWVTTGPILVAAVGMPLLGRFGDLHGHRVVFLAGLLTAGLFAVLTGFAWNATSLVAFRTTAQLGAAATVPSAFAMLFRVFPAHERVRASSLASGALSGASVIGIVVGGPLIELYGWRPIFFVQAGIGLAALLPALLVLPAIELAGERPRQDYAGAVLLASATFALTFGINRLGGWGVTPVTVGCLAAVPVLGWLLFRVERRCAAPLLPLQVLSSRNTRLVVAGSFLLNLGWLGNFIVTPLFMQSVLGLSLAYTSLMTLPRTGSIVFAAPFAGHVGVRYGERRLLVVACLTLSLAMVMLSGAAVAESLPALIVVLSLSGLAFGAAAPALVAAVSGAVAESDFGLAVSLQQTASQIGAVVGISLFSAIAADATTAGPFAFVYLLTAGLALATALIGVGLARRPRPAPRPAAARSGPADLSTALPCPDG